MPSYRGNAIAVGVLFIVCSAASILSIVPLGGPVVAPVDFAKLAANDNRVVLTALIEFVWAVTGTGIAIGLYPVLRKFNPALALGSVAGRVVENVFVLVGTLSLLALLTVSQQAAGSAAPCVVSGHRRRIGGGTGVGAWVRRDDPVRHRCSPVLLRAIQIETRPPMAIGLGARRERLLMLVATVYAGFTQEFGFTTINTVLSIPIGLQEMVLAIWLIVKGFNTPALASVASTGEGAA